METKEGIGFINDLEIYIHEDYPEFREYKEAFISLLQQGEKNKSLLHRSRINTKVLEARVKGLKEFVMYKFIWEKLREFFKKDYTLSEYMKNLEQKYFPKEVK